MVEDVVEAQAAGPVETEAFEEDVADALAAMPTESEALVEEPADGAAAIPEEVSHEPDAPGEAQLDGSVPPFEETQFSADESPFSAQASPGLAVLETEPVEAPFDDGHPPQEPAPAEPALIAPSPAFSGEDLEAAIRKVVAEMAPEIIRQVAWEVIPELAESLIKRRISELESDGE
jgi:hypothetical protein